MTSNILEQRLSREWVLYAYLLRDPHWITECEAFLYCRNAYSCIVLSAYKLSLCLGSAVGYFSFLGACRTSSLCNVRCLKSTPCAHHPTFPSRL